MNVIQEFRIRDKYMKGFDRNLSDITTIVLHGTGGGQSAKAIINWMLGGERAGDYNAGISLFHYEIDLNGDIYEIINPLKWVYHSEASSMDKHTIGIELLNTRELNQASYTPDQYNALFELISELIRMFPIDTITSHDVQRMKYSNLKPKPCPGVLFDWRQLEEYASENINKTIDIIRGLYV